MDYFSLDVEGAELAILKSIPFDKVDIEVFTIEVEHSDKKAIQNLMEANGYVKHSDIGKVDHMYVKKKKKKT